MKLRIKRDQWQLVAAAFLLALVIVVWYFAWNRGLINADEQAGYRLEISDFQEGVPAGQETVYDVTVRITDILPSQSYLLVFESAGVKEQKLISKPLPGATGKYRFAVETKGITGEYIAAQVRLYEGSVEQQDNLLLQQTDLDGIIK